MNSLIDLNLVFLDRMRARIISHQANEITFRAVATVCSVKDELKVRCLIPIGRLIVYSTLMPLAGLGCGDRLQHQG